VTPELLQEWLRKAYKAAEINGILEEIGEPQETYAMMELAGVLEEDST
jgi:hypothetical protein